jgi:hypothetical protein
VSRDWDNDEARSFAERVSSRRIEHSCLSHVPVPRSSDAAAWLFRHVDLVGAADEMPVTAWEIHMGDTPDRLKVGMMQNTKPFALWNVDRAEGPEEWKPGKQDRLFFKLGCACPEKAKDREGMPGKVRLATKELRDELEERALLVRQAFNRKKQLRNLLKTDLAEEGLGIQEDSAPPPPADE